HEETEKLLGAIGRELHAKQLKNCLEAISDPESRPSRIMVFIQSEAPPLKIDWLKWMASQGSEVTVVAQRHATDGRLFRQTEPLEEALGVESQAIGDANRLVKNLFASQDFGGAGGNAKIVATADALSECEWALRSCLEERHSTAIYVRDLDGYAPMLEAAGKRLGVSLQIQRRVSLCQNAFVRMTLGVLNACAGNDVRKFEPLFRSSYLGLTATDRNRIAGYLSEARRQRAGQWDELERLMAQDGETSQWLVDVLAWRKDAVASQADLSGWLQRLRDLVDKLPWHRAMAKPTAYDSQRDVRAFSVMQSRLVTEAHLDRVSEPRTLGLSGFVARCEALWEAADVSIPAGEGIPVVRSASAITGADRVFVLGMLEGVFPRRRSEDPVLNDSERAALSRAFPDRQPLRLSLDLAAEERDEFYRICAAAKELVTFSYPVIGDDRDNIPAFYLELIRQALGEKVVKEQDLSQASLAPAVSACRSEEDRLLSWALEAPREDPERPEIESEENRELLKRDRSEPFKPQELRDAVECAFKYQAHHRLGIRGHKRISNWSRLRRLPQDAMLASARSPEEARDRLRQALDSTLDRLFGELSEWELRVLQRGGERLIGEWVEREFEARKMWPKEGDELQNVAFGTEGLRDMMPGHVPIEGAVAGKSRLQGGGTVLRMYESRVPEDDDMTDAEKLYYGLLFLAGHQSGTETALELEGLNGRRSMLVLNRIGLPELPSNRHKKLRVVDLSGSDDPARSKEIFFETTKALLKLAVSRAESGDIEPIPGDYCDWCDYGELCRNSKNFPDEDSPFGEDIL
ncbi:MAG TPA: hypothetical protein VG944_10550, partial [Fimbriimonas sp.]|nr:hypothetical protein [Fimbriimonas sp.]